MPAGSPSIVTATSLIRVGGKKKERGYFLSP